VDATVLWVEFRKAWLLASRGRAAVALLTTNLTQAPSYYLRTLKQHATTTTNTLYDSERKTERKKTPPNETLHKRSLWGVTVKISFVDVPNDSAIRFGSI
jgi:hypothetical protein